MHPTETPTLPPTLKELLPAPLQLVCTCLRSKRGDRLFAQGRKPQQMFYVASGEVVLQRPGLQGGCLVLQRVRQGFVAEASLQSSSYHCDAVVTAAGDLIAVPLATLRDALLLDPAFAMRWIAMLNQELKRLRSQCERLSLRGVTDRLLHLVETEGKSGKLALNAGLKSVALELGVSHEALYRTVAELEKQGVLQRADGQLKVLSLAAL